MKTLPDALLQRAAGRWCRWILAGALALALALTVAVVVQSAESPESAARYEQRPATADGTGKVFLGREIAQVMGHQGADWLERADRASEERPDQVMAALGLKPGETVADIGAGTGYYSWRMARAVAPSGRVLAVDIQPEMLTRLAEEMRTRGVTNVVPVLGTITDPHLPAGGVDLVLLVDVYHECSHPYEMLAAICQAVKPGGRVVFVEFKAEDPAVPIKPLHKMTVAQVRREAALHPLTWVETVSTLPWQHLIVFRRNPPSAERSRREP